MKKYAYHVLINGCWYEITWSDSPRQTALYAVHDMQFHDSVAYDGNSTWEPSVRTTIGIGLDGLPEVRYEQD